MFDALVQKTMRVPRSEGPSGDGSMVARQLDAALLNVGFSGSRDLLAHVAGLEQGAAIDLAVDVMRAARGLVGDHVKHNAYFIHFPASVPDTMEFWVKCLREALVPAGGRRRKVSDEELRAVVSAPGFNLLDLPTYGRYQHSFEELLAAHDELIASAGDRITVLHLGGTFAEEQARLFAQLAGSTTPLSTGDLELLRELAGAVPGYMPPTEIPVRENRAVINAGYLAAGLSLILVDTVTDVLRIAVAASNGDVSLQTATKFRSFSRRERRLLLGALDRVLVADPYKLGDVPRFGEQFKRLGEGLHPHEYAARYPNAARVFQVARGELRTGSLAAAVEFGLKAHDFKGAAELLAESAPGMLLRSADRLLRDAPASQQGAVVASIEAALPSASGRVLLSLREHLMNRATPDVARVFVGRSKRAWVASDERAPLSEEVIDRLKVAIDNEMQDRLPKIEHLVVDWDVLGVALPLSGKASEDGFAVLPRGSRSKLDPSQGEALRFFCYWREAERRTDFDLSALLLDRDFGYVGQVSWTGLRYGDVVHSGDITESRNGATEFIEVPLASLEKSGACYVVPQVNIYSGEGFDEVAESMFGYMLRNRAAKGMPFEPRTVRMRSEMRGAGRVALPVMFELGVDGEWSAVWTHLYLQGHASFNRVEGNRLSTGLLARSIVERRYLTMKYLVSMLGARASEFTPWKQGDPLPEGPVTFVGREVPDGLAEGSEVFGLDRFAELLPG